MNSASHITTEQTEPTERAPASPIVSRALARGIENAKRTRPVPNLAQAPAVTHDALLSRASLWRTTGRSHRRLSSFAVRPALHGCAHRCKCKTNPPSVGTLATQWRFTGYDRASEA